MTVFFLFSYCFLTVFLTVFWRFFWRFSDCFLTVFLTVFWLFSDCFLTVFLLFSYCFLTVFWLFSDCYLSWERWVFSFHVGSQMFTYAKNQRNFRGQTVIYTFLDSTRPTESFKVKFELCHPATIKSLVFEAIFLNFFGLKKAFF